MNQQLRPPYDHVCFDLLISKGKWSIKTSWEDQQYCHKTARVSIMFSPPLDTSVENNHKRLQQQSKKMLQLIVHVIWKQAVLSVSNSDRSCIAPCFAVTKAELMAALCKVNLQLPLTSRAADVAAITQPSSMLEDSWCKQTILVLKTWRSHRKILGLYYLLNIPPQYLQPTT